jgi:hypothetical protein
VSGYTATFSAAGAPTLTCTTTALSCSATGARRGVGYMASVTATVPTGTADVGQAGPVVSASASGRVGATLTSARLKAIAGLKTLPTKVFSATKSVCVAKGTRLRLIAAGTCSVALTAKGRAKVVVIAVQPR